MTVEISEDGVVLAAGQAVDYATAYTWCIDAPERITALVEDTQAFAKVIAAAEAAPQEQQQAAVRAAFTAGRPKQPGVSWGT